MTCKSLREVGETALLKRLARRLAPASPASQVAGWSVGVGDDGAVLEASAQVVVSTDMVVEDVDFRRRWASWQDVGHKAAAINLSDMAAMGATPRGLTAALAASGDEQAQAMLQLLVACHKTGAAFGAPLVGGDLSETRGPLVLSVTAVGTLSSAPLLRHRGQVGDVLVVTGTVGAARAGLALLEQPALERSVNQGIGRRLKARQLRPTPRVAVGQALARIPGVHAAADVSDGLHKDVRHVLGPACAARIDVDALPVARGVHEVAALAKHAWVDWALAGGEDFELVLSVAPSALGPVRAACQKLGVDVTVVGHVASGRGVTYTGHAAPRWRHGPGFRHFAAP